MAKASIPNAEAIRQEMMEVLTDLIQNTADTCANVCFRNMQSLHSNWLQQFEEIERCGKTRFSGDAMMIKLRQARFYSLDRSGESATSDGESDSCGSEDKGADLEAMYDKLSVTPTKTTASTMTSVSTPLSSRELPRLTEGLLEVKPFMVGENMVLGEGDREHFEDTVQPQKCPASLKLSDLRLSSRAWIEETRPPSGYCEDCIRMGVLSDRSEGMTHCRPHRILRLIASGNAARHGFVDEVEAESSQTLTRSSRTQWKASIARSTMSDMISQGLEHRVLARASCNLDNCNIEDTRSRGKCM